MKKITRSMMEVHNPDSGETTTSGPYIHGEITFWIAKQDESILGRTVRPLTKDEDSLETSAHSMGGFLSE